MRDRRLPSRPAPTRPLARAAMLGVALALLGGLPSAQATGAATGTAAATGVAQGGAPTPADAAADLEGAVREYQAALARLLSLQEADAERASASAARYRTLYRDGLVARADAEKAEAAAAAARAVVDETHARIAESDRLAAESDALRHLAALPPVAPGAERRTPWVIEYRGVTPWTVARVHGLERFFAERFGRPLPVSALGQTALHDRMGLDHRNALDVAVHPDSAEGQALLAYLRAEGVPFLAFREARPGAATGAHVHVGAPSPRTS